MFPGISGGVSDGIRPATDEEENLQEVDDWEEGGVQSGEEEVRAPADFLNKDRGDHDDEKVPEL